MENVAAFLSQGDAWRDQAEPGIVELRRAPSACCPTVPTRSPPLWRSRSRQVGSPPPPGGRRPRRLPRKQRECWAQAATRPAATARFGCTWLASGRTRPLPSVATLVAGRRHALIIRAEQAAKPGTWTRDLAPLPETEPEAPGTADITAVTAVAALLGSGASKGKHDTKVARMLEGLAAREPGKYEPALTVLGQLLGAEAGKPPGKGRCDSAWCWDEALWLAAEAKSDHEPTGVVPHKDIRQANDQLRLLCHDRSREAPPSVSATVVVSPKPTVDPDGVIAAEGARAPDARKHGADARSRCCCRVERRPSRSSGPGRRLFSRVRHYGLCHSRRTCPLRCGTD